MTDLRVHVVPVGRSLALGLCSNICTSAFFLEHAVRIDYGGKAVLAFGGLAINYYSNAGMLLRTAGLVNALLTLAGALWTSAFWASPSAIAAFVAPSSGHGGMPHRQHVLHSCGACPNFMLVGACGYYSVFAALFAVAAAGEAAGSAPLGYAMAASIWHCWMAFLFAWSAMLSAVLNRATNATAHELQKLVGVRRGSTTGELPMTAEIALPQCAPPHVAPQRAPGGLFRFEHIGIKIQSA